MSNVKFFEGQEVKGIINNVTKDAVYVELEGENKGVIYTNDLVDYVEGQKLRDYYYEGQDFKALVKQVAKDKKSNNPLYILSTSLYSAKDDIKVFEELKENDEVIEAEVVNVTRAGADLRYKEHTGRKHGLLDASSSCPCSPVSHILSASHPSFTGCLLQ